ncbi:MAG: metallophosphoesterase [Sandaracinaceae bacterium]
MILLSVVFGVTFAVHYYLWNRLVKAPAWPAPYKRVGTTLLVLLGSSIPLGFLGSRLLGRETAMPLSWLAFIWMGVMFLLVVLLLPSELARLGLWVRERRNKDEDGIAAPERRQFLSRAIAAGTLSGSAGLSSYALFSGLRPVAIKPVPVTLRRGAPGLSGFKIVQMTDIHVGPTIGRGFIEQLVQKTNDLEPDLIAITGDLVDGSVDALRTHVAPLADLRARHGVFFVTGNHEYYSDKESWVAHLESLGIRVLKNENVTLEHDGATLTVAGVHDYQSDRFGDVSDVAVALEGADPDRPVLLLAHQPKNIDAAREAGVDLQISGHTHGGQIFPFNYLVHLQQPFVAGFHQLGDTALYVSRGTGYWGPPMRLGSPAEITEIVLSPPAV